MDEIEVCQVLTHLDKKGEATQRIPSVLRLSVSFSRSLSLFPATCFLWLLNASVHSGTQAGLEL